MTIQWSGDDDPPPKPARRYFFPLGGHLVPVEAGALPSARKPRDVAVVLVIALLIVAAGLALWLLGPLPRVFPLMS